MLHAHSGLRWIALILIIFAIINAFTGGKQGRNFEKKDKMINLFTLISFHTQLLLGLILYLTSVKVQFTSGFMKEAVLRFFAVEHPLMMLISIGLVTIGYSKSKKAESNKAKFKKITVFYTLALVILLAGIPWPFREALGSKWF
jgi:high-affinity Fe2+/Pb2+ permease